MIKILSDNKRRKRKTKLSAERIESLGKERLNLLNPMVIPMLAVQLKESPNNEFLKSSVSVITERPHKLSEKWINSLNRWVDDLVKKVMLDPPDVDEGERNDFGPFVIARVVDPKETAEYPMPALISVDERGWSWYFKTSKAYDFKQGDSITFTATVSGHKEGITFLRRPSKIKKVISLNLNCIDHKEESADD